MVSNIRLRRATLLTACAVGATLAIGGCNKAQTVNDAPPQVGVVTLRAQTVAITSELPGRVHAWRIAEVRPQINGVIQKRLFAEGSDVKAGQQLYQIDDAPYRAAYDRAVAGLTTAQHLMERDKSLLVDQAVSRQQFDDALAAYLQAQADVETARINLAYTKVYAPISGRIGRSAVTEGALVQNGQSGALAVIQQLDPIYVDVTQSSMDLIRLRKELSDGRLESTRKDAARVGLTLEDGSPYGKDGELQFSEVGVDETTSSVTLRAVFPNPQKQLLPGMFVHAALNEGARPGAILVPQQGMVRDSTGAAQAWVVDANGKAQLRAVHVDRVVGSAWLVNDGVSAGDSVVTEGIQRLRPGMTVTPVPATNGSAAAATHAGTAHDAT